jgi:hypothetical protein
MHISSMTRVAFQVQRTRQCTLEDKARGCRFTVLLAGCIIGAPSRLPVRLV